MQEMFSRTVRLIGQEGLDKLGKVHVIVFGIGGVGGHAAEALARGGILEITLVDNDVVSMSNLNRQLVATRNNLGMLKTEAMRERLLSINPALSVHCLPLFFLPENSAAVDFTKVDYIIDAVDTVAAKLALCQSAKVWNRPLISCMGAGNKLDPCAFTVADIKDTSVCPLARVMRKELKRKYGIASVKVVYSTEKAVKPPGGGGTPGSMSFVPGVAGLIAAGEAIKDILFGTGKVPR